MTHEHVWSKNSTSKVPYWLGGYVVKTRYHCTHPSCRDVLTKTTTPNGRLELALVLLMGVIGMLFLMYTRSHR